MANQQDERVATQIVLAIPANSPPTFVPPMVLVPILGVAVSGILAPPLRGNRLQRSVVEVFKK